MDLLAKFMKMQRSMGAFLVVLDMPNKYDIDDVFHMFMGQDVVVTGSFIRQNDMISF